MSKKMKKKVRDFIRGLFPKVILCMYIEKKHKMVYRSTVVDRQLVGGVIVSKKFHINSCENCSLSKYVIA